MSKKRFVEFYLAALIKAATGGNVQLSYMYFDLTHEEIVRVDYKHAVEGSIHDISATTLDLLEIAAAVIEKVRGMQK